MYLHEFFLQMILDVSKYKKEEVEVKVSKTTIRIEGKQVTKFSSRSFFKETPIPNGVEPETVKSNFTPDGHLVITAPLKKCALKETTTQERINTEKIHEIQQTTKSVQETKENEENFNVVDVKGEQKVKSSSDEETNKVTQVNDGKNFKVVKIFDSKYKIIIFQNGNVSF